MVALPSWQDKEANRGGMVRAALWLETEVGLGNKFTSGQVRKAFPDEEQIVRRLRDLRDHGWQIDTHRNDESLIQGERRYVRKGAEVWVAGQAKAPAHKSSLTTTQRNRILHSDNFLCRSCGIGAGESYGDDIELSVLNVARRKVLLADSSVEIQLVTECKRCSTGNADREVDLAALLGKVLALAPLEQKVLAKWIEADQRTPSALEKLWGLYRTLPRASREAVANAMAAGVNE
ncbi:hypothetical protein ACFZDG_21735 [Kitasatospora xanthocidica]|uniref:hypothetical protein n=1 Tax=Kitasatospora xanthocidica TaxID=83382 RepID=UPI0036E5DF78